MNSEYVFLEFNSHLFFPPHAQLNTEKKWGNPGEEVKNGEKPIAAATRILTENSKIFIQNSLKNLQLDNTFTINVKLPDAKKTTVYLFKISGSDPLIGKLKSPEWISIYLLHTLHSDFSKVFNKISKNRIWKKVDETNQTKITLQKGDKTLKFDQDHKLVITIMGPPKSGKYTQAERLEKCYGTKRIAYNDILETERENKTPFYKMVNYSQLYADEHSKNFSAENIPENSIGLIAKKLCENDTSCGYILHDFLKIESQCNVFNKIFLKKEDLHFSFFMDIQNDEIKKRIKALNEDPINKALKEALGGAQEDSQEESHFEALKEALKEASKDEDLKKVINEALDEVLEEALNDAPKVAPEESSEKTLKETLKVALQDDLNDDLDDLANFRENKNLRIMKGYSEIKLEQETEDEVFHLISDRIQTQLDGLVKTEHKSEPQKELIAAVDNVKNPKQIENIAYGVVGLALGIFVTAFFTRKTQS